MTHAQAGPSLTPPRAPGLYERMPLTPVWTGVVIGTALVLLYVASCLAFGHLAEVVAGTAPEHIYRDIRTAMVTIAGVAFVPAARVYLARATHRNLRQLWPALSPEGRRIVAERSQAGGASLLARVLQPAVAVLMLGFLFTTLAADPGLVTSSRYWIVEHLWHWVLLGPLGWMMGSLAAAMVEDSRLFQRLARDLPEVDLLDHSAFAPCVRQGLMGALIWILFLSVSSSLLLDLDVSGPWGVMAPAVLGIAILALVIPVWGAHQRIQEVKRDTLRGLRREIQTSEGALHTHPEDGANASRLRALLAYEARIERVREWPFDASTVLRMTFYMALGVSSWLGAALVERIVDALLD